MGHSELLRLVEPSARERASLRKEVDVTCQPRMPVKRNRMTTDDKVLNPARAQ
jgi:hypothetical protein